MWCSKFTEAVLVLSFVTMVVATWDNECPVQCKCKWVSSWKTAECRDAGLSEVPKTLNDEIQHLDLVGNRIAELPKKTFDKLGLVNIHKINLRNNSILEVHKDAFEGLKILIELDLSNNRIQYLHPDMFRNLIRLRILLLNGNILEKIDDGLFSNLKYLQRVELQNNNLSVVSEKAFTDDPKLQFVRLENNNLKFMKPLKLLPNQKLGSLVLHNNPWHCDCKLRDFRNWTIANNLFTPPTACEEPSRLRGRQWNDLTGDQFACKPRILHVSAGATLTLTSNRMETVTCKVLGDPVPTVQWILNNRIIEADNRHFKISINGYGNIRWANLTFVNVRSQDRGDLICSASNPGGVEERNITVTVSSSGIIPGLGSDDDRMFLPLIFGIVIGVIVILLIVLLIFYCFLRRKKHPTKADASASNGGANVDDADMEKSLITAVNPVTKPPRRYEAPSVASCGTEMSEINRTLLDNDSVFGPSGAADEESNSLDYVETDSTRKRPDHVDSDMKRPPDLLSFPSRSSQISPAGSFTSTLPDNSRPSISHGAQSPLHSPLYGTLPGNLFRTLPYSRSQSPFTSPVGVPLHSRQGYVTIPRRPRVPSWSAPSASGITPEVVDPVYDNLGLRTTADGSSVLSLNKSVDQSPVSMRGRPLPATPIIYQQTGLPVYYAPIEENEAPQLQRPSIPRGSSLQRLPISPLSESEPNRESWSQRTAPEGASLAKLSSREEAVSPPSPATNGTLGRTPKVPPKPPPKPKKKIVVSGPLFEDEGEDGTEV